MSGRTQGRCQTPFSVNPELCRIRANRSTGLEAEESRWLVVGRSGSISGKVRRPARGRSSTRCASGRGIDMASAAAARVAVPGSGGWYRMDAGIAVCGAIDSHPAPFALDSNRCLTPSCRPAAWRA